MYFESNNVLIQNHFEQDGKYYVDVSVPHKEGQLIARSDKGNIVDTYLYKDNLGQTYFSSISLDSAKNHLESILHFYIVDWVAWEAE